MVEIAGVVFFTGLVNTKIVAIGRCSCSAGITKCCVMRHGCIVGCIAVKAIAAKHLAKYVAIVSGYTLNTLIFAGVTLFASSAV